MSPTARSLIHIRKLGWTAQVVERWNAHAKVRQDLFGCIDLVVMNELLGKEYIMGVQATSGTNHNTRLLKALKEPRVKQWLRCGGKFEVWSWARRGTLKKWVLRRTCLFLCSIAPDGIKTVEIRTHA
jgi:hypothetical protein